MVVVQYCGAGLGTENDLIVWGVYGRIFWYVGYGLVILICYG